MTSSSPAKRNSRNANRAKAASPAAAGASAEPKAGRVPRWQLQCAFGLASAWVFVWVACAIWMAVGTLVAKQSHDRLADLRQVLAEQTEAGARNSNLVLSIDEAVARLDDRARLHAKLREHEAEHFELIDEITRLQLLVEDARAERDRLRSPQAADDVVSSAGAAVFRPASLALAGDGAAALAEANGLYADALDRLQRAKARGARLQAQIQHVQARIDELVLDPALELLAKDVRCVSAVLGLFFFLPDYLVTLMLTLAMGALGSVIFITHKLFKGELHDRLSWYVMRPFLGMTLALAMYILARAGQFAMTDPASGIADLNPFTIAFLGIISGLLSDQVYERITLAGQRLVSTAPQAKEPKPA